MAGTTPEPYHRPALVDDVVRLLRTDPQGSYLDLTAGGGGHLIALARTLGAKARLYGIDADPAAAAQATAALRPLAQYREIVCTPFADVLKVAAHFEDKSFDGVLLDLGISSRQIDDQSRGFSYRQDGPLDMRFDPTYGGSASDLVNSLEEKEISRILSEFGEERQSGRLARAIVKERQNQLITTTGQLAAVVMAQIRPPHQVKSLARVFQAFRIAVNHELDQLTSVLPAALSLLNGGGRLAVISYHSLEDRIVKRFFQTQAHGECSCPPKLAICACGSRPRVTIVTAKPITPTSQEKSSNPRARSAKLRVAEKLP